MKKERNYKTFEVGTHTIKMMPNLINDNKIGKFTVKLTACSTSFERPILINKTFAYCLVNNKVDIYMLSTYMYQIIDAGFSGELLVNSVGLILRFKNSYYDSLDINDIYNYLIKEDNTIEFNSEDPAAKTDIEKLQINLFDVKSEYFLKFDVIIEKHGYKDFINFTIIKQDPIYKDGDDKDTILNLYSGVFYLDDIIEDYKLEMDRFKTQDGKPYGPYLYDDEAKKYHREQRNLQINK